MAKRRIDSSSIFIFGGYSWHFVSSQLIEKIKEFNHITSPKPIEDFLRSRAGIDQTYQVLFQIGYKFARIRIVHRKTRISKYQINQERVDTIQCFSTTQHKDVLSIRLDDISAVMVVS